MPADEERKGRQGSTDTSARRLPGARNRSRKSNGAQRHTLAEHINVGRRRYPLTWANRRSLCCTRNSRPSSWAGKRTRPRMQRTALVAGASGANTVRPKWPRPVLSRQSTATCRWASANVLRDFEWGRVWKRGRPKPGRAALSSAGAPAQRRPGLADVIRSARACPASGFRSRRRRGARGAASPAPRTPG